MTERERLATLRDCGWALIAMSCEEECDEREPSSVRGVIARLEAVAREGGS